MSEKRTMPAYIRGLEMEVSDARKTIKHLLEKEELTEDLLLGALIMLSKLGSKPSSRKLLEEARQERLKRKS